MFEGIISLIVLSGILYFYLMFNFVVKVVLVVGVVVDNDIGLFFCSFVMCDWDNFDMLFKVVVVIGFNGKFIILVLIYYVLEVVNCFC